MIANYLDRKIVSATVGVSTTKGILDGEQINAALQKPPVVFSLNEVRLNTSITTNLQICTIFPTLSGKR